MIDPLAAFLEGRAALPEQLSWLATHRELDVLRRLCHGSPIRAAAAAQALAEALESTPALEPAPAPTPAPAPAPAPEPAPEPAPTPAPAPEFSFTHAQDVVLRILALEEDIARLAPWLDIGWHREGSTLAPVVHDRLAELERLLARAPAIAAIADLVGRLAASQRKGRGAERGGRESIVGVTLGGELADVLPSELALLSDPDTEDLFLMRLAERRLLSLELEGESLADPRDTERRGPALVCIDTSGSMIGLAEQLAKAATLVLLRRILGEGRRAEVVLFGGVDSQKSLAFSPGNRSMKPLFDLLMTSYHGGTDFDGPLDWALDRRRAALPLADIVVISDGLGRLHPSTLARLQAARAARPNPLRLVFVRIDTREPDAFAGIAEPGLKASPFVAIADEILHVRGDGSIARRTAATRSVVAKAPRTR